LLALTDHLGQDLIGAQGARIGRVRDLTVRLDERFPRVTAVVAKIGNDTRRIPWPSAWRRWA
jgi:hypothetical protein